jgi:hypothetical protein
MIELPDDELDKLFRKSSEELNPKYDPLDWQQLSKRLDEEDGVKEQGWLRKWSPLLLLLLISTGVITTFFVLRSPEEERAIPKMESVTKSQLSDSVLIEKNQTRKNTVSVNPTETREVIQTQISDTPESLTKSNSEKKLPRSRSKAGGVFLEPNRSSGKGGEGAFSLNESTEESPLHSDRETNHRTANTDRISKLSENPETPENTTGDSNAVPLAGRSTYAIRPETGETRQISSVRGKNEMKEAGSSADQSRETGDREMGVFGADRKTLAGMQLHVLQHRVFSDKVLLPMPLVVATESVTRSIETNIGEDVKPVEYLSPQVAFRFSYAPDLSTVGLKNLSKPGASVALLGEYGLSNRFYLQTGVIWSSKVYSATAGAYRLPKKDHYYGPAPMGVDGSCKVFEIPVNIRFDIVQRGASRWFAGAGVSSYHMNFEKYKYYFENENDPKIGDYRGWKGATGWYLASHLNASAGYEYQISKKLSLLGEPYVRIPVRRVGYGKVNLFTTGIWISIRYTPIFR